MPTILLVDDDRLMLRVLHLMFERAHYRVLTATGAEEALAITDHDVPDVMLVDEVMPGMEITELCGYLNANPATARVAVIMHCVGTEQPDRDFLRENKISAVLRKPSHPNLLLATVARCLVAEV